MKKVKRHRTNFISMIIVIITVALLVLLFMALFKHSQLETRYYAFINFLDRIDKSVVKLDTDWEKILCIFALYIAKCQLPIPIAFCIAISGMVFPLNQALAINAVFCLFYFTVKYVEGIYIGPGWMAALLNIKKMHFVRDWIQFRGNGNPYVLAVTRLIPAIPLAMVSKYYGNMRYDFVYYSLLSLLGFAPRIYMYTTLGAAYTNPFSPRFIIPLIIIVGFTGISSLLFNIFYGIKSKQMNQTLLIYSEKEKYRIVL